MGSRRDGSQNGTAKLTIACAFLCIALCAGCLCAGGSGASDEALPPLASAGQPDSARSDTGEHRPSLTAKVIESLIGAYGAQAVEDAVGNALRDHMREAAEDLAGESVAAFEACEVVRRSHLSVHRVEAMACIASLGRHGQTYDFVYYVLLLATERGGCAEAWAYWLLSRDYGTYFQGASGQQLADWLEAVPATKERTPCMDARIDALGRFGRWTGLPVPALEHLAGSAEPAVALSAHAALVQTRQQPGEHLRALIDAVDAAETAQLRQLSAELIGSLGPPAKAAVRVLLAAMEDEEARWHAIRAVGQLGTAAELCVPQLIAIATDEDEELGVRYAALNAVGSFGQEAGSAGQAIAELVDHHSFPLSYAALDALSRISGDSARAVGAMVHALEHKNAQIRRLAAGGLARLEAVPPAAVGALRNAERNETDGLALAAIREALQRADARATDRQTEH